MRPLTPARSNTWCRWLLTVSGLMPRWRAICLLLSPCAAQRTISRWRSVNCDQLPGGDSGAAARVPPARPPSPASAAPDRPRTGRSRPSGSPGTPSPARPPCRGSGGKAPDVAQSRSAATSRSRMLTTVTSGYDRVAMHGIRRDVLHAQAESTGLPLIEAVIPPQCDNGPLTRPAFAPALSQARDAGRSWTASPSATCSWPTSASWREASCARLGWHIDTPLFGTDTAALAREMIAAGLQTPAVLRRYAATGGRVQRARVRRGTARRAASVVRPLRRERRVPHAACSRADVAAADRRCRLARRCCAMRFAYAILSAEPDQPPQRRRVVRDVLADETGDEVVAVVVARAHAQVERMADRGAGVLQQLRSAAASPGIRRPRPGRSAAAGARARIATSSLASHAFHASRSSPRYAANAFCPHGTCVGATIGENADTLR